MRADKKKSQEKVAQAIVGKATKTIKEIKAETGLGNATIHRAKKELELNGIIKDENIVKIADDAKKIAELAQGEMLRRLIDNPKEIKGRDLNSFAKDSMTRYSFLKGSITDEQGGLKENKYLGLSLEELEEELSKINK